MHPPEPQIPAPGGTDDARRIFMRTESGGAMLRAERSGLSQAARRILILVDGQRCVAELPQFTRAGELERIVEDLRGRGLIRLVAFADTPDPDALRKRQREEQLQLVEIKRQLNGVFSSELGSAGRIWEARVDDCVSIEVLRRVLREAIDVLYFRSGDDAARRVVAVVKPLFSSSRDI